ncbi:phosphofurin acidic cluster sorting protein 1 isoform X2 [Zootermopsis nevadensis]|uniref:phosphofurin acidic cluster sorting protein 1 isoform X2 n=1 Tax=Zootermopsis nevadensis TaxID=136037 RepID=UPI000B8E2950|nr:phosphofurin acidic cluster sorting protein 1 isoform X2 [Zootermopsis nevadensis]
MFWQHRVNSSPRRSQQDVADDGESPEESVASGGYRTQMRLCSLTLSRLVVLRTLGSDVSFITIAVKMQGSKRTLRSNEMPLPANGLLDTELELNFALQYPHFLKRDGNKLHVMLQRRKRYKNRTILGFKTLAEGIINMAQVLQRQMDLELDLFSDIKDKSLGAISNVVARVSVQALNSQPVDHEDAVKHMALSETADRVADFSDDEEEFSSNDEGEAEGSDSEPMPEDAMGRRARKTARAKIPANARQRNLKQKFIALLKRFRVSEDLQGLDNDQEAIGQQLSGGGVDPTEIEDLFEELEDLSDSGPEIDTMSISSTPKPSLRPFFSSSRSLLQESLNVPEKGADRLSDESSKKADSDSHPENWTDHEHSDPQQPAASSPPKNSEEKNKDGGERERKSRLFTRDRNPSAGKTKKQAEKTLSAEQKPPVVNPNPVGGDSSLSEVPRKQLTEQLSRVLPADDASIPDHITLVNVGDPQGSLLAMRLQERQQKVVSTLGPADIRAAVTCLVSKIQKFCNSSAKPPPPIKVLLAGSDSFVNSVLRNYVDQLSFKPPEWQNYIKFLIVPLGNNSLARYLSSLDGVYASAFSAETWKELLERAELQKTDCQEMLNRVHRYLHSASATIQLPVAEAMITYKEKSSDEESSQIFVPFVNDVRLGSPESSTSASVDLEEVQLSVPQLSGSPPSLVSLPDKKDRITPPSSPNINSLYIGQNRDQSLSEPMELQLDYWLIPGKASEAPVVSKSGKGDTTKSTLKTTFRSLQIQRLPLAGEHPTQHFLMSYSTKEKKQKIMRLGKKKEKEKESEPKSQVVEGVSRLICSAKTHSIPLKVSIDGTEWSGVKFFQLSAQWQTHIKHFPITLFNFPEANL